MSRHHAVDQQRAVIALDNVRLLDLRVRQVAGDGFDRRDGARTISKRHPVYRARLHAEHHQNATPLQRAVDRVTA